ncbi:hypothetical protein ACGFZP_13100 [Kitasatospora sp. NPDC048239]|uniref:hypothetical protein n=1 Tax=Kitasatospora sp. NPDC048239 TaxID=3364046 RepID=UPI00371A50A5
MSAYCDAAQSAANHSKQAQPPCDGPVVAHVVQWNPYINANGCVTHAARMLAALPSAEVFALEDSPYDTVQAVREAAARL